MTAAVGYDIICMSCGDTATLPRVTAGLMCGCGSIDLDLWVGSAEQRRVASRAPHQAAAFVAYTEYPSSSVPTHQPPGTVTGWTEYQGPMPGVNPLVDRATPRTCPVCHGSKRDPGDGYGGAPCRFCQATGVATPLTSQQPPITPRHQYPSNQTQVPYIGTPGGMNATPSYPDSAHHATAPARRYAPGDPTTSEYQLSHTDPQYSPYGYRGPKQGDLPYDRNNEGTHYPKAPERSRAMNYRVDRDYSQVPSQPFQMPGSACPNCGHQPLELHKDHNENAWATCQRCGPLANIDRHPEIDPYSMPEELPREKFTAPGSKKKTSSRKTGRVWDIVHSVIKNNSGLGAREAVLLARQTVTRY